MSFHTQSVGIAIDARIYGIPCARAIYGDKLIQDVLALELCHEDSEGSDIVGVFDDNETCQCCFRPVLDCTGEPLRGSSD